MSGEVTALVRPALVCEALLLTKPTAIVAVKHVLMDLGSKISGINFAYKLDQNQPIPFQEPGIISIKDCTAFHILQIADSQRRPRPMTALDSITDIWQITATASEREEVTPPHPWE